MANVYLDNASTTPVDAEVRKAMEQYSAVSYGNPSSLNKMGIDARKAVEDARASVANVLGCRHNEIIFTSGGTESNNLAIQGAARANKTKGRHVITTTIEHSSVLNTCKYLESEGYSVTYLKVNKEGFVDFNELEKAIRKDTILITVGYVNSEIGTVQDIASIGAIARKHKVVFHTDACQAAGYLELNVDKLKADLMTLNGAKIYGPKGVGVLYKRTGVGMKPLFFGGEQEFGLRAGTENVPAIVGFAKALELSEKKKAQEAKRTSDLRDYLIQYLLKMPGTRLNGPRDRVANNVNVSFSGIEGESLVLMLNDDGFYASTGSACSSRSSEPSYVLTAIGLPYKDARSALRITLGRMTTKADIEGFLRALKVALAKIR